MQRDVGIGAQEHREAGGVGHPPRSDGEEAKQDLPCREDHRTSRMTLRGHASPPATFGDRDQATIPVDFDPQKRKTL